MNPFIHLRCHSEYSLVDGLPNLAGLLKQVQALEMPAIALTDETNLFAAIKFYKAALSAGIKPIFGADCWLLDPAQEAPYRFTLLCLSKTGFQQLTELISEAYLESPRKEGIPLIRVEQMQAQHLSELICLNGGLQGEAAWLLQHGHDEAAKASLVKWQSWFGPDRFFVELQRLGFEGETQYNAQMMAWSGALNLPLVATQNVRFLHPEDFPVHEIRVAIHEGCTLLDKGRAKRYRETQYLASGHTMAELFKDCPSALQNTWEIAKRCNVFFELDKPCLPAFSTASGESEPEYLRRLSQEGLEARLKLISGDVEMYRARLRQELDVIISMGFSGYFLIVADFIQWAKSHGVPVGPGRGSGAGSLVAFALKITDIDPLPYDLLFERFLNPERVSMPDFDVDFCMDGRDRVIDYVAERYGRFSVSQIITYGSMAAKAVIRDVGRVMSQPYGFVDSIAKLVPLDIGITLDQALEQEERLKARYEEEEDVRALIDMAKRLEGTVRNVGKHAGGVVIAPSQLTDFTPIYCEEGSKQLVSQYDKDDVESAGLVKFDFLGLRNLTIIDHALKNINRLKVQADEPEIIIETLPLEDLKTFELLKACKTTAVFQLESRGMKDLIHRLQPDCFEEIIALVALFRPGPLQSGMVDDFINIKHGRARIEYPHPLTEPILKPTYGIILYQEQVMLLAQVLAGYTLGGADLLRRAMGKKKPEEMAQQREIFIAGALKNNIPLETSQGIFDLMEKFAGYGFNKSHSAAYALLAYQTAYLKAHYPAEFMAAVLSSDMDNTDKVVVFLEDCRLLGIQVLPPDINQSHYFFTVKSPGVILYGLGAIKGVGEQAVILVEEARTLQGPFLNVFDFCRRLDLRKVNRRVLEALIAAGAMDSIGPSRPQLMKALESAVMGAEQQERVQSRGQEDLFGAKSRTVELDIYPEAQSDPLQILLAEKAVLGLFLSAHPLKIYEADLKRLSIISLDRVRPTPRGESVRIAGVLVQTRRIKTKKGQLMLILTLDDGHSRLDATVFPDQVVQFSDVLKSPEPLLATVEIQRDDFTEGLRARVLELQLISHLRLESKTLLIHLAHPTSPQDSAFSIEKLACLKQLLAAHPGPCRIALQIENSQGEVTLELPHAMGLKLDPERLKALADLMGERNLRFE